MTIMKNWSKECESKIIQPDQLKQWAQSIHDQKKTIVTLNGSFDLLHAGHLQILFEAKEQGDILLIALNSDASIKKYKSEARPIIPLQQRMQLMAALSFVDYVTFFNETDPRDIIEKVKPNVHVNGASYGENCIESNAVLANGGKLHLVNLIDGFSTTNIINKIKALK